MRILPTTVEVRPLGRIGLAGFVLLAAIFLFAGNLRAQPVNDNFLSAKAITGALGTDAASNAGATSEANEPAHANQPGGASVWYRWTAPRDGLMTFSTLGSSIDTVLAVYGGTTLSGLVPLAANNDAVINPPTTDSLVRLSVVGGTTYYIAVDGYFGEEGNYVFNWAYEFAGEFLFTSFFHSGSLQNVYEYSETEGFRGARITVTRRFGSSGRVLVDYATSDGTAVDGPDYTGDNGTLVFNDGQMSATILISIQNDGGTPQAPREFTVTLSNPRLDSNESTEIAPPVLNATDTTAVRILDVDVGPSDDTGDHAFIFNFDRRVYRVQEDVSTGVVRIFVNRTGTNTAATSISYRINFGPGANQNNTFQLQAGSDYATPDVDYAIQTSSLSWASGDMSAQEIQIPILNDTLPEFNEDFLIQLFALPTDGVLGYVSQATVTILDEDQPAGAIDRNHLQDNSLSTSPPLNATPGANRTVYAVAVQPDQKTVIAGEFTSFNTTPRNRIARMNFNGQLDTTFNPGSGADGFISSLALQTDGKVIVGGGFTSFNGLFRGGIARLNADGSVDTSFKPGTGVDGIVWAVAVDPNGKIIIGGDFTTVNGTNRVNVARLNPDGSLDTAFDPGPGPGGAMVGVAAKSDTSLLIVGEFLSVAAAPRSGVARLTPSGAVDATFEPGGGADDTVFALKIQNDGRILLGGAFRTVDLRERRAIARLNTDGSLDLTFNPGTGANDTVYAIELQNDGRIFIGGMFTRVNGTVRRGICRLYSDGLVDTTILDTAHNEFAGLHNIYFDSDSSPRPFVFGVGVQNDGGVLIGGSFSRGGGGRARTDVRPRMNVARLIGGETRGSGNIGFESDSYTGDENGFGTYITLARRNGDLGTVAAAIAVRPFSSGPGVAEPGADFSFDAARYGNPFWRSSINTLGINNTRMISDGISGPNNATVNINGQSVPSGFDDVFVDIAIDGIIEGDESLGLELVAPHSIDWFSLGGQNMPLGVALGRSKATLTIVDRDSLPGKLSFSSASYAVNENATNATITVVRTEGSSGTVTVRYETSDGTARSGQDYTARAGTLTFGPGVTNRTFTIPIINDSVIEQDETINLRLYNPTGGASLGLSNAVVTVIDDDLLSGRVQFSEALYKADESGLTATITVTRTGGSLGVLSVQFATSNLTAIGGNDYVATNSVLTWNSGDNTPKTFTVRMLDDGVVEGDETVGLHLFNPSVPNALGLQATATLTIVDDDFFGTVQFISGTFKVNENAGWATVMVTRTNGFAQTVSVNFQTINGTANTSHYTPTSGTLIFGPGEMSKTFDVRIQDNPLEDGNRFLTLQLSGVNPSGQLGAPATAILTIVDDETFNEPAGSLDTSFGPASANNFVHALALQEDGKIVVGGDFTALNGFTRNRIARINDDGTLDTKFSSASLGANTSVRAVALQSDKRILIGGTFTMVNNTNRNGIARLNADGSLDGTFNPGAGANNHVFAVAQNRVNGTNVLIGGAFTSVNGVARNGIARLSDTGMVDLNFNPGLGANGPVYAIAIQPDGKVLVAGDFTLFNGVPRNRIVRLNANGSVDTSFDPGSGANAIVRALAIQVDGRILLGGAFTSVNGTALNRIARLNSNGSVDTGFTPGAGANDAVYAIAVQLDGKILLGGEFTQASGVTRSRITRLKPDGTVDPTINFGLGANSFVSALILQADGKIVLGGGFTSYDGVSRPCLARVYGGAMDGVGKVEFAAPNFFVNESATNATVTLRRRGGTKVDPQVGINLIDFATSDLTALSGSDYIGTNGVVDFPEGETFRTISVRILNDDLIEDDETVLMTLSSHPNHTMSPGNQPFATLTIVSDDSAISFESDTFRGAENAVNGVIPVNVLRVGSKLGTATVDVFTTGNGTATSGADYQSINTTLTFAPGETLKTVAIPVTDDALIEGDESFDVELSNANGAFLLQPITATVTIVDDDFGPGFIAFAAPGFSALENGGNAVVTLIRTNGSAGSVSVSYATSDGSAVAGVDYVASSGMVTFGDGETSKNILVPVIDDAGAPSAQGSRVFTIALSNPAGGATLAAPLTVPVTILDNEIGIRFATSAFVVNEGGTVNVTVLRENVTNSAVTVTYRTQDLPLGAVAGVDYVGLTNTLTFLPGETVKTFAITSLEDSDVEGDEAFQVVLSNPTGGAFLATPSTASVTIIDNDSAFNFSSAAYSISEDGSNVTVTVVRTNGNTGTVSVKFATSPGLVNPATPVSDYISTNGTLTFLDGETVKTFTVQIVEDTAVEGDETVWLTLSDPSTGTHLGPVNTAVLTILDNDAGLRFFASTYSVMENGVSAVITVVRTNFTNNLVSVDYTTSDGTAVAGQDYQAASGNLVFQPGETSKTFEVFVIDDTLEEGNETVLLKLLNPVGSASVVSPSAATLTIIDNDGSIIAPAGYQLLSESNGNGLIDTNETVSLLFALRNTSSNSTTNLVATLLATNGIASPSGPQSYGVLAGNGSSVSRPFTFTGVGTNGARITATLQLQDGATDLGRVTFTFVLGTNTTRFANTNAIIINDNAPATPYPSPIVVSGINGSLTSLTVTLTNINHAFPDDMDVLLVGPAGQSVMLMSDAGGSMVNPLNSVTLTFSDAGPFLPDAAQITSGTYRPTDWETFDILPPPAPVRPYSSSLGVFNGSNPNGVWSLYVADDVELHSGNIARGWFLTMTTSSPLGSFVDLSAAISATPSPVIVSNNLTFSIQVTNHGPSTATGVVLTNTLPAGATLISVVSSQGTVVTNGSQLRFNLGTLPMDSTATITVVVRPNSTGTAISTVAVGSVETDLHTANNSATASPIVNATTADLAVSVVGNPNPAPVFGNLTYTIQVTNYGPATATAVMVTNSLPSGLSNVTVSPVLPHTISGSVVTISLGSLASGASATMSIHAVPTVSGDFTNFVSVGSSVTDPLKGNNNASVKTLIQAPQMNFQALGGGNLQITWPVEATGYALYYATNLTPPVVWTPVTSPVPAQSGNQMSITVSNAFGTVFYRLQK